MGKEETKSASEKLELRRDVTMWGSYMLDYELVESDIYASLGWGLLANKPFRRCCDRVLSAFLVVAPFSWRIWPR